MSVLPSFKSAFSSLAEIESTDNIQIADDSGLINRPSNRPTPSNSALAPQSAFQDHFPPRTCTSNLNSWSYLQTASTDKPRDHHLLPAHASRHQTPSLSSRPTIPPLPLELLSSDAPSFYLDNRSNKRPTPNSTATRKFIEPLPLENLGLGTDSYLGGRPDSFKRSHSPSVHAGAYKRPRSQSVSLQGAYVKVNSHSSSERHPNHHTATDRRDHAVLRTRKAPVSDAVPYPPSRANSRPIPTCRGEARSLRQTPSPALTLQAASRKIGRATTSALALRKSSTTLQEQSDAGTQMSRGERARNDNACGSGTAGVGGQESLKIGAPGGGSRDDRVSPGPASVGPDNDFTNSGALPSGGTRPMNLVTFAAPSFSHRSAGSKPRAHGYNSRILSDDIFEDSTSRVAMDVLGSPRQLSYNSTGTTRRLRCWGTSLALSRGPTASDLSLLVGESRERNNQKKPGTAEISVSGPETIAGDRDRDVVEDSQKDEENVDGRSTPPIAAVGIEEPALKRAESEGLRRNRITEDGGVELARNGTGNHRLNGREHGGNDPSSWRGRGNGFDKGADNSRSGGGLGYEAWRQGPKPETLKANDNPGEIEKHVRNFQAGRGVHDPKTRAAIGRSGQTTAAGGERWTGRRLQGSTVERNNTGAKANEMVRSVARNAKRAEGRGERNSEDGESVQCPHCPRRLRNAVTLQNHVRVVHDHSGNFRCEQCGLTFMWRSTLGNHVRLVHEKQRPFACKECAKAFRWESHLREHYSVTHRGEKPFKCETCGKRFGRKNNMQKHMRKHKEKASR